MALDAMVRAANFKGWEWFSEFRLNFRNGQRGAYHGVLRLWNTPARPAWLDDVVQPAKPFPQRRRVAEKLLRWSQQLLDRIQERLYT
jgi:hypothetical protein